MKVSLNWIKEYTKLDVGIDELVDKIGKQLGAVEEVVDLGAKYQGIIVAKVVSCERHPNADRLSVCWIDDGGKAQDIPRNEKGLVQVVCGAPNVTEGLTVAWLPPGSTVPSTLDKDPFVLEARELRGVVSNGMIASAQELAISDDHSGIVALEKGKPGDDFAKIYGLDDYVIDIENKMFTHRPDCFGILGVAREIAGITGHKFVSPAKYLGPKTTGPHPHDSDELQVENLAYELSPRFTLQIIKGVEAQPSPLDMQIKLMKVGLKAINNIVDVTNYFMVLTGQPMHAYDYDKLAKRAGGKPPKVIVRRSVKGEKLQLLNGKTMTLQDENSVVIADSAGPIGLGGVMGGSETEVDETTRNIVLESANFDMYTIRRTSMQYGLFTDAVTRFSKGQSAWQNDRVLSMACDVFIHDHAAVPNRSIYDLKAKLKQNAPITLSQNFINERLGLQLSVKEISVLLSNVEFETKTSSDSLTVTAPFWRTDIEIAEDVVEEVGRLFGYEKMLLQLPLRSMIPTQQDEMLQFKSRLRKCLAGFGANEVLTYSFVNGDLLEKTEQSKDLAFKITNALSPDLQYYRLSLTPSLLAHIHPNIKAGHDRFALFEMGKAHNKLHIKDDGGVPKEYDMLAFTYANDDKKAPAAYFTARTYLDKLAEALGITIEYKPIVKEMNYPVARPFDLDRSALAYAAGSKIALGVVGEFKASVRKRLKLPVGTAGFEIGLQELLVSTDNKLNYRPLSRYPAVTQDICLQVTSELSYGELTRQLTDVIFAEVADDQVVDYSPIDIYASPELNGQKRITYRVTLISYDRTLTDEVLSGLLNKAAEALHRTVGAVRI